MPESKRKRKTTKYCVFCRKPINKTGRGQGNRKHCLSFECDKAYERLREKKKKWAKQRFNEKNKKLEDELKKERRIAMLKSKGLIL